ncbi:MAG: hypothetical protein ACRD47_01850 [Nitrososphaeraceae archaeon]
MSELAIWLLLGIFLAGGILMKGQQSERIIRIPQYRDNTTILIEEEKEQEEINDTTATNIEKERFVDASKK